MKANERNEKVCYVDSHGDNFNVPSPFKLLPMLKDAARLYPIISNDGTIVYAYYGDIWNIVSAYLRLSEKEEDRGNGYDYYYFKAYDLDSNKEIVGWRMYGVGFKDIPKECEDLYIRGIPMFNALPFDEIKKFAQPQF